MHYENEEASEIDHDQISCQNFKLPNINIPKPKRNQKEQEKFKNTLKINLNLTQRSKESKLDILLAFKK
jgi:hypothetical protein